MHKTTRSRKDNSLYESDLKLNMTSLKIEVLNERHLDCITVCGFLMHSLFVSLRFGTMQGKLMQIFLIRCAGWGGVEWEHIDPWVAKYRRVDGFQEVTLTNSDEHLTNAQLVFPQRSSLAPATSLKSHCRLTPSEFIWSHSSHV